MAESFTSYSVDNDMKFRNALKVASEVSDDLRVPLGLIRMDFYKSQQAVFTNKGPGKYPPFKNSVVASSLGGKGNARRRTIITTSMSPYQKRKLKLVQFDYPLLVRYGDLSKSLLGPNNKGSISQISKTYLIIGTSIAYGIYHQSDAARKSLPLRKFLFIGPEAPTFATSEQMGRAERWLGYISDHIDMQMKKAVG